MRPLLENQYADLAARQGYAKKEGEGVAPQLANMILNTAVEENASDIHVEPKPQGIVVRFRIDGILHEVLTIPSNDKVNLIPCFKVMADIDSGVGGAVVPRDGRFNFRAGELTADVRLNSFPNLMGEKIAMRVLVKDRDMITLDRIGLQSKALKDFRKVVKQSNGMILVTGPTGSGKTTTLYSTLSEIAAPEINICTLEDPIEYEVAEYNQAAINKRRGFDFAMGLRALLRQDPDVILVGEIRDEETAEVAVRAALTGHLLFSTLHTNDAGSTVARLIDMGIDPYLLANCLRGVLSQRLARRLCNKCAQPDPEGEKWFEKRGFLKMIENPRIRTSQGCPSCYETGWHGRIGLFEFLMITEEMREILCAQDAHADISNQVAASGSSTLQHDGLVKVTQGMTSLKEVLRLVADSV